MSNLLSAADKAPNTTGGKVAIPTVAQSVVVNRWRERFALLAFVLCVSVSNAYCQGNVVTVQAQIGAEPGEADPLGVPAGRYHLFSDDGLFAMFPDGASVASVSYKTDTALNMPVYDPKKEASWALDPYGYGPIPVYATAGRFVSSAHDDVVSIYRDGNPANLTPVRVIYGAQATNASSGFDLPDTLLPRQKDSSEFLAINHADLDEEPGKDGNLHDEVIVARVTKQQDPYYGFRVDVLDYSQGDSEHPEVSSANFADFKPFFNLSPATSISGSLPSDNILTVTSGDFLGDGHKEIALVALGGDNTVLVYLFKYELEGGRHVLRQIGANFFVPKYTQGSNWDGQFMVGTIAATAADLKGDKKDQLVIGYAKRGLSAAKSSSGRYGTGVAVVTITTEFRTTVESDTLWPIGGIDNKSFAYTTRPRVDLVSGQFVLDPPTIPLGRHQLVLGWLDTNTTPGKAPVPQLMAVNLQALAGSDDLKSLKTMGSPYAFTHSASLHTLALAAGGFQGTSGTKPLDALAVSTRAGILLTKNANSLLQTFLVGTNGLKLGTATGWIDDGFDYRAHWPLIAYDKPGNSRYLGAPVHLSILGVPRTDYIMQEPPKHLLWDEKAHNLDNFTRFDKNNVHLFQGSTASMKTTSKDMSARETGVSVAVSASATTKTGADLGIAKAGGELAVDVTMKAGYDYKENEEKYNSTYEKRTIESTGQTDRDDFLKGEVQTTDVWRYRVFGTPKDGPLNAYYEIVFPGPKVPFAAGGLDLYWYQPRHENGNILSYPSQLGRERYIPADIGEYTLANKEVIRGVPQVPAEQVSFNGTAGSLALKFSKEVLAGSSFTYSKKISVSSESKVSFKATTSYPSGSSEFGVTGSVSVNENTSWGNTKVSESTTTDETSVVLNRIAGNAAFAYPFYPVIYNTQDGAMKMTFAVPNPANSTSNPSGYGTYANAYGGKPDPALNLPLRFLPKAVGPGQLEEWTPNQQPNRKAMRGLFFRQSEKDPIANTYLLQLSDPEDGDIVRIEPRIYNYSTAQDTAAIDVEYQVIPYDSSLNSEICDNPINARPGVTTGLVCPRSDRKIVGRTQISGLTALQFSCVSGIDEPADTGCSSESAFVNWNTKGYGPPRLGTYTYHVYAVLNPYGVPNSETYGLEPAPVAITDITNTTPMTVTAPGSKMETGDYVTIGGVRGLDRANGTFRVTLISADTFSLDGTVISQGAYSGSGSATKLDPGQNNEGYGTIGVTHSEAASAAGSVNSSPSDFLESDALEAVTEDRQAELKTTQIEAEIGQPLQVRFTAHSSAVHPESAQVLLFDGNPTEGAPAIADQVLHPGENGVRGSSVWFNWTPTTLGIHHLYAILLEGPEKSQTAGELDVNVVAVSDQ